MNTVAPVIVTAKRAGLWPQRLLVLALSLLLFIAACATPGLHGLKNGVEDNTLWGITLFLVGWSAIFVGQFAWFANPLMLLAWVLLLCRCWRLSALAAVVGTLIALHTIAFLHRELSADEGDVNHVVFSSLGIGFYLWLGAFLILVPGNLWLRRLDVARTPQEPR